MSRYSKRCRKVPFGAGVYAQVNRHAGTCLAPGTTHILQYLKIGKRIINKKESACVRVCARTNTEGHSRNQKHKVRQGGTRCQVGAIRCQAIESKG